MATSRRAESMQPPDRTPRAATHAELADTIPPPWATQGEVYAHPHPHTHVPKGVKSPSNRRDSRQQSVVPGRIRNESRLRSVSGRHSLLKEGGNKDVRMVDRPRPSVFHEGSMNHLVNDRSSARYSVPGFSDQPTGRHSVPGLSDQHLAQHSVPGLNGHPSAQPSVPARPSVFHEGSMNDRVSNKPPANFTGDDEDEAEAAMERYAQEGLEEGVRTARGGPTWLKKPLPDLPEPIDPTASTSTSNRFSRSTIGTNVSEQESESSNKRPGFFKMGRSLAAAFTNPVGIWDDLTQRRRGQVREEPPRMDLQVWEDRRQRAEQAYAAMKREGRFPTTTTKASKTPTLVRKRGDIQQKGKSKGEDPQLEGKADMEPLQSVDGNRLQVPSPNKGMDDMNSSVERGDGRNASRSSLTFKKRSVPNLKKVKSDIHRLTSESLTALLPLPLPPPVPTTTEEEEDVPESLRSIRKQISRKDLHRQHKLSKRVSDLESKLESARRELEEVRGKSTPTPTPGMTSPGIVPTLSGIPTTSTTLPTISDISSKSTIPSKPTIPNVSTIPSISVYHAPIRRGFVPALASLPSERILLREQEAKEREREKQEEETIHEMDVDSGISRNNGLRRSHRTKKEEEEAIFTTKEQSKKSTTGKRKSTGQDPDAPTDGADENTCDSPHSASKRRRNNKGNSQTVLASEVSKHGIFELEGSTVNSATTIVHRRPSEKVLEPRPRMLVQSIAESSLGMSTTGNVMGGQMGQQKQQPKWNLRPRRSSLAAPRYQNYQMQSSSMNSTGTSTGENSMRAKEDEEVRDNAVNISRGSTILGHASIVPSTTVSKDKHSVIPNKVNKKDTKNGSTEDINSEEKGKEMVDTTESHQTQNIIAPLVLDAVEEEVEEVEEVEEDDEDMLLLPDEKRRKNIQRKNGKIEGAKTKVVVQEFEWPDDVF
ncbi:MAG: velvet protein [Watsoniomyces obsoletus]|nr:MAG: velvet protein [Watsoniomyces obsoletus]